MSLIEYSLLVVDRCIEHRIMTSTSETTCPICVKTVLDSEEGIGCDGVCQRWFHRECFEYAKNDYNRICADNKVKWHCSRTDCIQSSDLPQNLILKQLTILTTKIADLADKVNSLTSLPAKVDSLVCKVEGLNKNLSQLESRLSVNESKVLALEEKLKDSAHQDVNNTESIIAEMSDRARRSKNDKNAEVRVKHDNALVSRLLDKFLPNGISDSLKTARVGKKIPDKIRPLKVILSKESDVISFLSSFSPESAAQVDQRLAESKPPVIAPLMK
ncbi:hypothetical protein J6590_049038 [Homalodisca vitripennis]|nr:hypothetical protein J6590_049038 [Homalodisca vitripennis]